MKLPADPTKYNARFKYVEVAKYVPSLKAVIREKKKDEPVLIQMEEVQEFADRNNRTGIYTSVLQYDSQHLDSAASLGSLCFDLDSANLEDTRTEALRLVNHLLQVIPESALRVFFSGGKGFHIECEPIALNIGSSDDLPGIYRHVAEHLANELQLQTIDLVVYDKRRMWRLPNTRHQRTGLFKIECMQLLRDSSGIDAILKHAEKPHDYEVPEQEFNFKANQWYREFVYQFEESKKHVPMSADLLERFLEQGSGHVHMVGGDKVFDQFKLYRGCPAVAGLVTKAKTQHHLDHYERLFLCSLLTYTEDAVRFLHEVFSHCHDYNFEISSSHIDDWIKRREYGIGGRPYTCEKAKQVGISCSGCGKMEPRKKMVHLSDNKVVETNEFSAPSPVRHAYSILKGN